MNKNLFNSISKKKQPKVKTKNKTNKIIKRKVGGAVAFEYIIVLVIMVGVIFASFSILSGLVETKLGEVEATMSGTGVGTDFVSPPSGGGK